MQVLTIILSLFGLLIHAIATKDKTKFDKTDLFILTIFLTGLMVPVLTLIFNFI